MKKLIAGNMPHLPPSDKPGHRAVPCLRIVLVLRAQMAGLCTCPACSADVARDSDRVPTPEYARDRSPAPRGQQGRRGRPTSPSALVLVLEMTGLCTCPACSADVARDSDRVQTPEYARDRSPAPRRQQGRRGRPTYLSPSALVLVLVLEMAGLCTCPPCLSPVLPNPRPRGGG
jgi:hypothetical protein